MYPCGTQLPWELLQEEREWGKAPKEKMEDRNHHFPVAEPDMVLQHPPPYPHTKGNPPESDLRGVCVALAAGQANLPGFGVVLPEVNAQLEQDQTVLTRAVRRKD